MRILLLLNILLALWAKFNETGIKNRLKTEAEVSYSKKDYSTAIIKYKLLLEKYKSNDENVKLNLAHAYFNIFDTTSASIYYNILSYSKSPKIKSIANLQQGIIAANNDNKQNALKYFKEALKADAANEEARYNYELVKKLLQKDESNNKQKNNKNKQPEQSANPGGNKEGEKETEQQDKSSATAGDNNSNTKVKATSVRDILLLFKKQKQEQKKELIPNEKGSRKEDILISNRLKKYHLDMARAKQVLEAMSQEEIQFIQQRKKYTETNYPKSKPDY